MSEVALITGASKGIGHSLCYRFAQEKIDLVVVARSMDRLVELREDLTGKYGISVTPIAQDLAKEGAAEELYSKVKEAGIHVDHLVNNAGFGDFGKFDEESLEKYDRMADLNVRALTDLTHLFLKDMLKAGSGKIMNVSSLLGFQACPYWAVYSATKAYVLSFTEAISEEYKDSGVTFTALCPGTVDTDFIAEAEGERSKLLYRIKIRDPDEIADFGYRMMMKGKVIAVPGTANKIIGCLTKIMPRAMSRKVFKSLQ
ncbi:MAG: SDR family oxidoreductase [Candidatus Methanomethylophilaceae archaeon]|jgi:short-subunit dehydrogenase